MKMPCFSTPKRGLLMLGALLAGAAAAPPVANAPILPGFATAPTASAPTASAPTAPAPAAPTTASDYMAVAAAAVAQRQAAPALRALGRAETRLISRSVPLFQTHAPITDPAVRLIERARQAVRAGDFATAARLITLAVPLVAQEQATPPPNPPVGLPSAH